MAMIAVPKCDNPMPARQAKRERQSEIVGCRRTERQYAAAQRRTGYRGGECVLQRQVFGVRHHPQSAIQSTIQRGTHFGDNLGIAVT
jgi:hypothetical protein